MTLSKSLIDHVEVLLTNDNLDEAEEIILPIVESNPDSYDAWHKLAALQMRRGDWEYAVKALTKAQEIFPTFEPVWYALAYSLNQMKFPDRALQAIRQLLVINPRHTQAMQAGGEISYRMGRFWDAWQFYEKYLSIFPHQRKSMLPQLVMCLQYAEQERQDDVQVKITLADLLTEIEAYDQAQQVEIRAKNVYPQAYLKACPDNAHALMNLIENNMMVCNWQNWEYNCNKIIDLVMEENAFCNPSSFQLIGTTQEEQYVNAVRFCEWKYPDRVRQDKSIKVQSGNSRNRRIGYISSDFHEHATAYLISGLFKSHSRERFTIIGYSTGIDDKSEARQRIIDSVDEFVDLKNLPLEEAVNRIKADNIDILVDLKGWTMGHCNDIIAQRPAPILVNYLGYPGTSGGLCDYIIADRYVIPEENQKYFTEKVIHIDGCYQINSPEPAYEGTVTRSMYGLPEHAGVFACFNQAYKITPAIFSSWMQLLKNTPNSVLWVLEMMPEQMENLKYEAQSAGIEPERIVPMKFKARPEHLARMQLADYYLETSPVTGHTTLSDWLRNAPEDPHIIRPLNEMTFVNRVCESLMRNRDTLYDTEATTRRIEAAYEAIIDDYNNN